MRLRSVHSLCSFRSRLYIHFEILIHYDSLHFIPLSFISPTSAPHSISGLVTPLHNPRCHSISFNGCLSTHVENLANFARFAAFHPQKQPVELHSIPQRIVPFRSLATYALFQRITNGIFFFPCDELAPKDINAK